MPLKQFIGSIGGADMAYAQGAQNGGWAKDYYQEKIAQPMDGETPEQAGLRLGGSAVGPVGNPGGQFGTAMRSGLQGMTFGAGDEIVAAGASALDPNGTYDQYLDAERDRLTLGRDQFPKTAIGAEIGGAVMAPGAAFQAAKGAALPLRMGAAATTGAAQGGLYGFMTGEGGIESRLDSAADVAPYGAIAGPAGPALGSTAARIWDMMAGSRATKAMVKAAPSMEGLRAAAGKIFDNADQAQGLPRGALTRAFPDMADKATRLHIDGWACRQCCAPIPMYRRADARYCCEGCRKLAARRRRAERGDDV